MHGTCIETINSLFFLLQQLIHFIFKTKQKCKTSLLLHVFYVDSIFFSTLPKPQQSGNFNFESKLQENRHRANFQRM